MPRAPKADHTACPNCGHSPIGESDERCPSCYHWVRELPRFHAARADIHNDAEQELGDAIQGTRIGGPDRVTNAAEAYPGYASALLALLGIGLGCLGMGMVPATGTPQTYLGLGAFDLLCAIVLFAYPAMVRSLVAVSSLLQVVTLLHLGRAELRSPQVIALALVPLMVLVGTSGEPGPKLRSLAFSVGTGLLVFSGVVRAAEHRLDVSGVIIDAPEAGFRAQLPSGFVQLGGPDDLKSYLPLGELDPQLKLFAFADPVQKIGGLWGLAPAGRYTAPHLAQGVAESLNTADVGARPVAADLGIKIPASTYERGLGAGHTASASAVRLPDNRVAVLLVGGGTSEVQQVRNALVRGAAFGTATSP